LYDAGTFCARICRHDIRAFRSGNDAPIFRPILFLRFSDAAGGGRIARTLKFAQNPPEKPPANWRLFCRLPAPARQKQE